MTLTMRCLFLTYISVLFVEYVVEDSLKQIEEELDAYHLNTSALFVVLCKINAIFLITPLSS